MFSFAYNYVYFFFNYELLVLVCFLLFLFFALLSEKGAIGSYLQELSIDARTKLARHLLIRQEMIQELSAYLDRSSSKIKMITTTFLSSSQDILYSLQHVVKKLSKSYTVLQVRYYLDTILSKTQILSNEIRIYLTNDLFVEKNYVLSTNSNSQIKKLTKLKIIL
jgi:hypothetical protein